MPGVEINIRKNEVISNPFSNADGGGLWGGIAQGIGSAVSGVAGAVGAGKAAKQDRIAREAEANANVKIAKDQRTAALSSTTQELIKANEQKQHNKQKTNLTIIVFTVLVIASLGYFLMKEPKP